MELIGKSAAPGIAVGRIFVNKKNYDTPKETFISKGEEQAHLNRYHEIKRLAAEELEFIRRNINEKDANQADIFTAHLEILDDIIINEEIPSRIQNDLWSGDWAIFHVYQTVLTVLTQTQDPLIAERASDFDDVRSRLLRLWYGNKPQQLSELTEPVIIAAAELLPSETASMDKNKILAILTETGGITSHTAIIAKSYGIPAIMGIAGLLDSVVNGQFAVVNADEGTVLLNPEKEIVSEYEKKCAWLRQDRENALIFQNKEACTSCGVKIDIGINIADSSNEELAPESYSDFVGLFRTEFIYMGRSALPSCDEQFVSYKKVLEHFGEKPVILRTMDIGGDKKISSLNIPTEENPFLGNRALRLCFTHPEIFRTQIEAALKASVHGNLWLMLPMVCSIDDIRKAKKIIESVKDELVKNGTPIGKIKIGTMIEIPSIALVADHAAREVDFASIGTNDLCQYLCAADRMNSAVDSYYQSYHPSVFKLIKETANAFNKAGKPLSICGELASDTNAVPILVGLGIRKMSMGAASIAKVKRALASVSIKQCEELAEKALACATADEIKNLKYI